MEGWPYAAILKAANARPPDDAPRSWRLSIVDEYAASYGGKSRAALDPVTQSAIATANTRLPRSCAVRSSRRS